MAGVGEPSSKKNGGALLSLTDVSSTPLVTPAVSPWPGHTSADISQTGRTLLVGISPSSATDATSAGGNFPNFPSTTDNEVTATAVGLPISRPTPPLSCSSTTTSTGRNECVHTQLSEPTTALLGLQAQHSHFGPPPLPSHVLSQSQQNDFGFKKPADMTVVTTTSSSSSSARPSRPQLHKSHSVAYGTDSTVLRRNNTTPAEANDPLTRDYAKRQVTDAMLAHSFPLPLPAPPIFAATASPDPRSQPLVFSPLQQLSSEQQQCSSSSSSSSSFPAPGINSSDLFHPQNSFGFECATPLQQQQQNFRMLRRCESLGFDDNSAEASSDSRPERVVGLPGVDSSSSRPLDRCRGSLRKCPGDDGPGKWRRSGSQSTLTRRQAFRTKPLRRGSSRTGVHDPGSGSGADSDQHHHHHHPAGSTLTGSDGSGTDTGSPSPNNNNACAFTSQQQQQQQQQQSCVPKHRSLSSSLSPSPSPECRRRSRRRSYQQSTAAAAVPAPTAADDIYDNDADNDDDDDDDNDDNDNAFEDESEGGKAKAEDAPDGAVEEEGKRRRERSHFTPPPTPSFPRESPKTRRVDMGNIDPYQVFEVNHLPCIILQVRVVRGRNITNGWLQDQLDTPDPYIKLRIRTAPEGRRRTRTIDDNANPLWNETFVFFLPFSEVNVLEVTLMEANPFNLDQEVGTVRFNIQDNMEFGKWQSEVFNFSGVKGESEVDIDFHVEWDQNPTLRYSLCLSDAEKDFIKKRKEKTWQALNNLLGDQGPQSAQEAPTIAVIGSGGGFRAMTGYSGVFKALSDTGLLDCATYACGLSGSSWYLSTLYSHPRWPDMSPGEMQSELMSNIDKSLMRLLGPQSVLRYLNSVLSKRREGQPVSFTDFFGHMVGETLLKGRLDSRLTAQREKIRDGDVPLPLYTCVHVKKDVPAMSFQEWVEFSPYEIGMPKYGTFMDSELFGSKFFMGKLVRKYNEPPLHFLQGIWGSAFCILFKRLLEDNRNLDPAEMIRQEMGHQLEEQQGHDEDSSDISDDSDNDDDTESDVSESENHAGTTTKGRGSREGTPATPGGGGREAPPLPPPKRRGSAAPPSFQKKGRLLVNDDNNDESNTSDSDGSLMDPQPPASFLKRQDSSEGFDDVETSSSSPFATTPTGAVPRTPVPSNNADNDDDDSDGDGGSASDLSSSPKKEVRFSQLVDQYEEEKAKQQTTSSATKKNKNKNNTNSNNNKKNGGKAALRRAPSSRRGKSRSYWTSMLKGIFENQNFELLSTRAGRAAVIHNFMRGLNLQQTYPLSPFTPLHERVQEGDEFDGIFEMHPTHIKHIYMVDAGLTFNSPYPLILRPQREVDIILSFDFSGRPSDCTPPFKELLLAAKWAKVNRLPFPPIDPTVVDREGLKELYVFQDPDDPHCPVVLHFPLVNIAFRKYKAPGVPRKTKDELDFADFDIFDDPAHPYSTFNFTYTHQQFQRLSQLTEFNTRFTMARVKQVLAEAVARKRQAAPRVPVQSRDFKLLRMKSVTERRHLKKFLKRMESRGKIVQPPTPSNGGTTQTSSTPFLTPTPTPGSRRAQREERNPFTFTTKSSSSSGSGGSAPEEHNPFFNTSRQNSQASSTSSFYYDALSPPNSGRRLSPSRHSPGSSSSSQPATAHFSFPVTNGNGSPPSSPHHHQNSGSGTGHPKKFSKQNSRTKPKSPAPHHSAASNQNSDQVFFASSEHTGGSSRGRPGQTNSKVSVRRRPPVGLNRQHEHFVTATSDPPLPSPPASPTGARPDVTEGALRRSFSNHATTQQPASAQRQPSSNLNNSNNSSQQNPPSSVSNNGKKNAARARSPARRATSGSGQQPDDVPRPYEGSSASEEDEFHDAPEAFRKDGTPVTDQAEATKHQQGAKQKRMLLRRQSTISSLSSSITASVSLDDPEIVRTVSLAASTTSTSGMDIDITDLDQFVGTADDHQNNNSNNDEDDDDDGDVPDDEDPFFDTSHRGSVVSKDGS